MYALNPKKPKDFFPSVASKLDVNEKLVTDIVGFYWKEVKQSLLKASGPNIVLEGLGTFKAKGYKLPDIIEKYERIRNKYKPLTDDPETASFQKFTILKETEQRLEILNALQLKINQETERQQQVKHKRNVEGKTQNNMEKPSPDMGGILESSDIQEDD